MITNLLRLLRVRVILFIEPVGFVQFKGQFYYSHSDETLVNVEGSPTPYPIKSDWIIWHLLAVPRLKYQSWLVLWRFCASPTRRWYRKASLCQVELRVKCHPAQRTIAENDICPTVRKIVTMSLFRWSIRLWVDFYVCLSGPYLGYRWQYNNWRKTKLLSSSLKLTVYPGNKTPVIGNRAVHRLPNNHS